MTPREEKSNWARWQANLLSFAFQQDPGAAQYRRQGGFIQAGNEFHVSRPPVQALDMVREKSIWDLKTTSHVNEAMWLDSEVDYGYINQAEWYASLYAALNGTYKPFCFLCVSKREPHNVWIRKVPNHLMAMGRQWRQDVLRLYERYCPREMRDAQQ